MTYEPQYEKDRSSLPYIKTSQEYANPYRTTGNLSFSLVLAGIFIPFLLPIGFILGIYALNKSKQYGFDNPSARLAVIIGIILLSIILFIIFFLITFLLVL